MEKNTEGNGDEAEREEELDQKAIDAIRLLLDRIEENVRRRLNAEKTDGN